MASLKENIERTFKVLRVIFYRTDKRYESTNIEKVTYTMRRKKGRKEGRRTKSTPVTILVNLLYTKDKDLKNQPKKRRQVT